MDVPLMEDDTCIDDIRVPTHISTRVMKQNGMHGESLTNQSMYMTQRSTVAADASGVAE